MDDLKLSYELDKLNDIVEERIRLITVLGIKPSSRDNVSLKKQLSKTLDLLNECSAQDEVGDFFEQYSTQYSDVLQKIPDSVIDVSLYEFHIPSKVQSSSSSSNVSLSRDLPKKVRFKDENLVTYSDVEDFKPYHDDASQVRDTSRIEEEDRVKLMPKVESPPLDTISPGLSNQEVFVQQQQQLLEQDTYLSSLSESVHRSHAISLDINGEVVEQNDHVLQDLESLVDNSGRNLDRAKRRLETFEKTARDNGPCFIIVVLVIILLVLLIIL